VSALDLCAALQSGHRVAIVAQPTIHSAAYHEALRANTPP